jgi:cysteine desulfurase
MQPPIYLDYAASTPIDPRVLNAMLPYLSQQTGFGNPAASHFYGREAAHAIEQAREYVAALIQAKPSEIIWTSGATESNNLAIKGIAYANAAKGKHIITAQTEHSSVLDTCKQLEREGFTVTYLQPETSGIIAVEKINAAIKSDTFLISIMHINNEIGVMQDIAAIGQLARQHDIYFHVDAVQSAGKVAINLAEGPIDLMSLSAHKIYGPKGVGALYIKQKQAMHVQPLLNGGGQENNLRPGTLATHQIVGMGAAFALAKQEMATDIAHMTALKNRLWQGIAMLPDIHINGEPQAPHILNIAFEGIESKLLLPALKEFAIATGSACHAPQREASHVLRSLGLSNELAQSSIRFSWGRFTTEAEIDHVIEKIHTAVKVLRGYK